QRSALPHLPPHRPAIPRALLQRAEGPAAYKGGSFSRCSGYMADPPNLGGRPTAALACQALRCPRRTPQTVAPLRQQSYPYRVRHLSAFQQNRAAEHGLRARGCAQAKEPTMKVKMILPALTEATSPHWRPIKYALFPPLGLATLAGYLDPDDD